MYGSFESVYGNVEDTAPPPQPPSMEQPYSPECAQGVCQVNRSFSRHASVASSLVFAIPPKDQFRMILGQFPVVVVKAWAPWCQPCKIASQKYQEMATQFLSWIEQRRLLLLADNIEDSESIHRENVDVVPTFFVYFVGKLEASHIITGIDVHRLSEIIRSCLNTIQS